MRISCKYHGDKRVWLGKLPLNSIHTKKNTSWKMSLSLCEKQIILLQPSSLTKTPKQVSEEVVTPRASKMKHVIL
jgi:hypothetical protein